MTEKEALFQHCFMCISKISFNCFLFIQSVGIFFNKDILVRLEVDLNSFKWFELVKKSPTTFDVRYHGIQDYDENDWIR
jgi:hypothetical protein